MEAIVHVKQKGICVLWQFPLKLPRVVSGCNRTITGCALFGFEDDSDRFPPKRAHLPKNFKRLCATPMSPREGVCASTTGMRLFLIRRVTRLAQEGILFRYAVHVPPTGRRCAAWHNSFEDQLWMPHRAGDFHRVTELDGVPHPAVQRQDTLLFIESSPALSGEVHFLTERGDVQ